MSEQDPIKERALTFIHQVLAEKFEIEEEKPLEDIEPITAPQIMGWLLEFNKQSASEPLSLINLYLLVEELSNDYEAREFELDPEETIDALLMTSTLVVLMQDGLVMALVENYKQKLN